MHMHLLASYEPKEMGKTASKDWLINWLTNLLIDWLTD